MQEKDFQQIKANMKARKITGTYIAFQTSRSASNINDILRGNYPYYKGYGLPKYLYDWLVEHKLLDPTQEGFLTRRGADLLKAGQNLPAVSNKPIGESPA